MSNKLIAMKPEAKEVFEILDSGERYLRIESVMVRKLTMDEFNKLFPHIGISGQYSDISEIYLIKNKGNIYISSKEDFDAAYVKVDDIPKEYNLNVCGIGHSWLKPVFTKLFKILDIKGRVE